MAYTYHRRLVTWSTPLLPQRLRYITWVLIIDHGTGALRVSITRWVPYIWWKWLSRTLRGKRAELIPPRKGKVLHGYISIARYTYAWILARFRDTIYLKALSFTGIYLFCCWWISWTSNLTGSWPQLSAFQGYLPQKKIPVWTDCRE